MKIQIIGLPGAGKTTGILSYLKTTPLDIQYLDIRHFAGRYRDRRFKKALLGAAHPVIAESACGVSTVDGTVIAVRPPVQRVYSQLLQRDKTLDEDYLSLLSTQMIPAHYTIGVPEELPNLLRELLEG